MLEGRGGAGRSSKRSQRRREARRSGARQGGALVVAATLLASTTSTLVTTRAAAQPAPAPAPPPTTAPDGAPTVGKDPQIAPPSPGASPAKVEEAKEVAKAAQATPIVPDPKNPTRPAFQLYAELDLPVLGIGAIFAASRLVRTQKAFCAPLCDPNDLNALDRTTAGFYSVPWRNISDAGLYGTMALSAALLLADEGPLDALNDAVVVAESALSATAVSTMLTLAAGRPRPFLYGTNAPLADRDSADAGLSFLSSHASVTSSIAFSTFMTMKRLHPTSSGPYWVLAVGGALSLFVASARVMAGSHFITDSIGGMVVGSSLGVLVPVLHQSPVKIVPVVSDSQRGLGIGGTF
jgi:membrane-associated phospholipid phosphatase